MLGGVAAHLIVTIRNNALLLKKRKSLEELEKIYGSPKEHVPLDFKKASPEEIRQFHKKVLRNKRRDILFQVILGTILVIFLIVAFICFIRIMV